MRTQSLTQTPKVSEWRGLALAYGFPISATLSLLVGIEACRWNVAITDARKVSVNEPIAVDTGRVMTMDRR
jgi:hypothetical protein